MDATVQNKASFSVKCSTGVQCSCCVGLRHKIIFSAQCVFSSAFVWLYPVL